MLALINPDEKVYDNNNDYLGFRVCYFYEEEFEVSEPLFFIQFINNLENKDPQFFYYDENEQVIKEIPEELFPKQIDVPKKTSNIPPTMEEMVQKLLEQKLKEYGITINQPTANTP